MQGSNFFNDQGIGLTDPDGNAVLARGTTVPTLATAGYAVGAQFLKTNGSDSTTLYVNRGTAASCDFQPLSRVAPEAVTATADGLTTGQISTAATHVTVTSANADHIVVLPAPVVGKQIVLHNGATGYELRTTSPTTIAINGGTGAAAESAIPANSTCFMTCVTATAWKGFFLDADSDVAKVEAAA